MVLCFLSCGYISSHMCALVSDMVTTLYEEGKEKDFGLGGITIDLCLSN